MVSKELEARRGVGLPAARAAKAPIPMTTGEVPYWLVDQGYVPRELTEEEEAICVRVKSLRAQEFLRWFPRIGTLDKVCQRVGISGGSPSRWERTDEAFAELYGRLKEDTKALLNSVSMRCGLDGFEDRMYNADGNLVGRRVRQDPSFLSKLMAKVDPEWRNVDQGQQINIVVQVVPE